MLIRMTEEFIVYKNILSKSREVKLERQIMELPRNEGHLKWTSWKSWDSFYIKAVEDVPSVNNNINCYSLILPIPSVLSFLEDESTSNFNPSIFPSCYTKNRAGYYK